METPGKFNSDQRIRDDNDFLKMKIMLERGAGFINEEAFKDLPPLVENLFLKNIMDFEQQYEQKQKIKVFDRIGRPDFKPVAGLTDDEIEEAWDKLSYHMIQNGVSLDACSPKVSKRELYRFTVEEFFQEEMNDIRIPGMIQGFIYDEYYPDIEYDNTSMVVDYCISRVLRKTPMEFSFGFKDQLLTLNDHYPLDTDSFLKLVNGFKDAYDEFEEPEISNVICKLEEKTCNINGKYKVKAKIPGEIICLQGKWETLLELDETSGNWYIGSLMMEGIQF